MTTDKHTPNPLSEELSAASAELEARKLALLKDGAHIVTDDIVSSIEPLNLEVDLSKIKQQDLVNLAAKRIAQTVQGRIMVPQFQLANDKTSPLWVYVGTYWEGVKDAQHFYDFVRSACLKMGVGEDHVDNPSFAKKLYKMVELKLSRYPRKKDTDGTVLINLLNGVLEIDREGRRRLRPHRRDDFFRYVLPFSYDEQACCPRFSQFLDETLPDRGVQRVVLEYFAYCLVPWLHIEKLMALLGGGSNGKSKLLQVLEGLFGKGNVAHENLHDLTYDDTHRANIEGKPVNLCTENEGRINASVLRTMVSGETITCKRLYSQPYETDNYAKLLFAFNEMPQLKMTEANKRRWILVKFNAHFSEEEADTELGEKLLHELPGILNLVLSVLPDLLRRRKFSKSEEIDRAVAEMEYDNDPVMQFLKERCELQAVVGTKASDLYKGFCDFCEQTNTPNGLKNQGFYKRLEELGQEPFDYNKQKMYHIRIVRYED